MSNVSAADFASLFGAGAQAPAATNEKAPAKVWLNIGYTVDAKQMVDGEMKTVQQFVSLPVGIPLDTMVAIALPKGKNKDYRNLVAARNVLMKKLQEISEKLEAGEDTLVPLQIQMRRVDAEVEAVGEDENQYVVDLPI